VEVESQLRDALLHELVSDEVGLGKGGVPVLY